jgi:hypothetical protein
MVERMEQAFRRARDVYQADGRKILNATIGGQLEVFERTDYYSLFSSTLKKIEPGRVR